MINRKALILSLFLLFTQGAKAVVFEVTTAEEFQAALTVASDNGGDDQILIAEGVYNGPFRYVSEENHRLRLIGSGPSKTILDGEEQQFLLDINLNDNRQAQIDIEGITLRNGFAQGNGAALAVTSFDSSYDISESPPTVRIKKVEVLNSKSTKGNVVYFRNAVVSVENSSFTQNEIGPQGSLSGRHISIIHCENCDLEVQSSEFSENIGPEVGGQNASISIQASTFAKYQVASGAFISVSAGNKEVVLTGNTLSARGGVTQERYDFTFGYMVHIEGPGSLSFEQNSFDLNPKVDSAAFWDRYQGHVKLSSLNEAYSNEIARNKFLGGTCGRGTTVNGEAIASVFFQGSSNAEIANNLWSNLNPDKVCQNKALRVDDFISLDFANNTLAYRTIASRKSLISLKADVRSTSRTLFVNNILWASDSNESGELVSFVERPLKSELRNNVLSNEMGFWDAKSDNVYLDPRFSDPESESYYLQANSPAVDAGLTDVVARYGAYDLDGNPRVSEGAVDIGAYERFTETLHPADNNGDSEISQEEFEAYNAAWRTNEAWPTAPAAIPVDFVTRAGYLLQKGGAYKNIGVSKPATWVPIDE
jgi:hypothetical protein